MTSHWPTFADGLFWCACDNRTFATQDEWQEHVADAVLESRVSETEAQRATLQELVDLVGRDPDDRHDSRFRWGNVDVAIEANFGTSWDGHLYHPTVIDGVSEELERHLCKAALLAMVRADAAGLPVDVAVEQPHRGK